MNWRILLLLYVCGLIAIWLVARFQTSPGYMDAEYYYSGGYRLANGFGFSDPFIWNYLDNPQSIPHPSHAYWMPLVSILSAFGMVVSGRYDFFHARIVFIVLSAAIPPLTAWLSYTINKRVEAAIFSGLLAVFSGFYLAYLGTTDAFGLYMLFGALWFLCVGAQSKNIVNSSNYNFDAWRILGLGIITGLMHLTRADGWIWLGVGLFWAVFKVQGIQHKNRKWLLLLLIFFLGYLVIMAPWIARNMRVFGSPLSIAGARTLWITDYDDIYVYPPEILTVIRWWDSGIGKILSVRTWALGQNLQTTLAVQNEIFLLPLVVVGLWRLRSDLRVKYGILAWLASFVMMTVFFPFTGVRGGFFHSGAAIQPLFWAVAPTGFDAILQWGVRLRKWNARLAGRVFRPGLIAIAMVLTLVLARQRVIGLDITHPAWNQGYQYYSRLGKAIIERGIGSDDVIVVNNPPGFFLSTNLAAIVIPDGDQTTLLSVARRFGARYVLLDDNHPSGLATLYNNPGDEPGLEYLTTIDAAHIFRVLESP